MICFSYKNIVSKVEALQKLLQTTLLAVNHILRFQILLSQDRIFPSFPISYAQLNHNLFFEPGFPGVILPGRNPTVETKPAR